MMLHVTIIALECAALAAFLILWHMVIRKKLRGAFLREAGQQILLPFRYFSWVLMALVLVTCLVQLHFVWLSSQIQEEMVSANRSMQDRQIGSSVSDEVKALIDNLRTHTEANIKELRSLGLSHQSGPMIASATSLEPGATPLRPQNKPAGPTAQNFYKDAEKGAFEKEARASSARKLKNHEISSVGEREYQQDGELFSMRLNNTGNVTRTGLRVRKQPSTDADVVEKLASGQQVKVTEKRMVDDTAWFRVITPSGTAGWVNYRYLRLDAKADNSSL
jgi:hypothetical protein